MKTRLLLGFVAAVSVALTLYASVPSTIDDFFLPGSQPLDSGEIKTPTNCDCHGNYSNAVEPQFNWKGSMMAQAARDPLFYACMTISNQDVPESGDLCIRCHSPKAWLEGRSDPTDASHFIAEDREGVVCHFCHKMVKPSPLGVNPYPGDSFYTANTYLADSTYLATIDSIPEYVANGMYVVADVDYRRGPYTDANPPHDFYYSPFQRSSELCGTCHDVSNPAFSRQPGDDYDPNTFGEAAPAFNPHGMFPIERTYSEWSFSDYNTPDGVYAPQFGGNLDTVRSCLDCHMRDVEGKGAKQGSVPVRTDLGLHDLTGGNTFMPAVVQSLYSSEVDSLALAAGTQRATYMLENAASFAVSSSQVGNQHQISVTVTNETGHKLPSGYPEGRRMWLNIRAYNDAAQLIYESGAYDSDSAVLTHDADVKIYEIKLGISNELSPTVGIAAGPSFHFVLNDSVFKDNRIPPRGFTNANFDSIQSPPVAYVYADGQYWDETSYLIPGNAAKAVATLYYQSTSKEYVEFLRDENVTDTTGQLLYDSWTASGKSAPVVMNTDSLTLTPIISNQPPVLASIGPQSTNENELLTFIVTASDLDGDSLVLSAANLPTGATFTDHFNDSATFSWTPTYDQAGDHDVTFYVRDIENAVDSEVVTISVTNVNRPPILASIGSKSTNEGELLAFIVTATDLDNDSLVLLAENLPTGATFTDHFNDSATFAWTPDPGQAGNYTVRFIVRDELLAADSEEVSINVTVSNEPPVLAAIGAQNVDENELLSLIISATDLNTDSIILSAANLPTGATLTDHFNDSATFSWTPTYDQSGNYDVTFYAHDEFSAVDSELVTISVANVNRPPDITAGDDQAVAVGEPVTLHIVAADPDNEILDITARVVPDGAVFADHGDGTADFDWIPASDQTGDHQLIFDVTDGEATDSAVVLVSVTDVCCVGRTGDVDQTGAFPTEIDSSDLGTLVNFLFSPPGAVVLPCPEEADVDAQGGPNPVDSSDLGTLVNFLFSPPGTVTLPDCP